MRTRLFFLILFVMIGFFGCVPKDKSTQLRPNILVILVDDLGWADLGYTGNRWYETPTIDSLAASGMVFTNAYASSPVCSPSRAALISGKHPARLNLTDYIPGNRHYGPHKDQKLASHPFNLQLDLEENTLAEAFKESGYVTFFAGKWHLGESDAFYPDRQGFDINIGGNKTGHPAGGYFAPYHNPQLVDGEAGEYLTDRLTDETIKFIRKNKEHPFFAFVSFYTVHLPLQGKPEKVKKYETKFADMPYFEEGFHKVGKTYFKQSGNMPHYAAMVESLDENVGRLLRELKAENLLENTLVVFTSDNGGMATSDQPSTIPTTNLPLRAGKGYLYEGGIRVPLIFSWVGQISAGSSSDFPTSGTDLYPTLLAMTGLPPALAQHPDGLSLEPLIHGKELNERPLFWHYPHYSGGLGGRPSGAVRLGDFKLIEFFEEGTLELYNLKEDVHEAHNLAASNPEKVKELKGLMDTWRRDVAAILPFPNPAYEGEN